MSTLIIVVLHIHVGTLSPDTSGSIPTVTDNLLSAGTISAHEIGISFEPITSSSGEQLNGEITWGVCIYFSKTSTRTLKSS